MPTQAIAAAMAEGVSHAFANGVVALEKVSVTIEPGSITGIIGHNGSGKTTLFRILAGLLPSQSGTVRVLGETVPPISRGHRARVAYIAQSAELDPEMTVS